MKTLRLPSFIFLSLLFIGAHIELKNNPENDKSTFKIGPEEQRLVLSVGGGAIFQLIDLDGSESVRIEVRSLGIIGSWITLQGFGLIKSPGTYLKTTQQMYDELGIGIFLWRITDNNNSNHSSDTKLLVIVLL